MFTEIKWILYAVIFILTSIFRLIEKYEWTREKNHVPHINYVNFPTEFKYYYETSYFQTIRNISK